jgi:alanyl-tRNA synthetase
VYHLHLPGHGPELLQQVARRFVAGSGSGIALLTGAGFFVLDCWEDGIDLAALGAEVAEILDGRGGGKGQLYQGKAAAIDSYPEALAHLRRARRDAE